MKLVFDDEENISRAPRNTRKTPWMYSLLISYSNGLIRDEETAAKIALIVCGILILLSLLILSRELSSSNDFLPNVDAVTGERVTGEF